MKLLLIGGFVGGLIVFPVYAKYDDIYGGKISGEQYDFEIDSDIETGESPFQGLQFGTGISGTSGINMFLGYANKDLPSFWLKRIGLRFDFATTIPVKTTINNEIKRAIDADGIEYDGGLFVNNIGISAKHTAAMIDFYPFGNMWFFGGWRITGGYYSGNLKVNADLTGGGDCFSDSEIEFELSETEYKYIGDGVIGIAKANWKYRGPYLGTGIDVGIFAGLKIYIDAGVVFTNKTAMLNFDIPAVGLQKWDGYSWVDVDSDTLRAELDEDIADALADTQSDLDKINFFPIVKVGFMYRF